MKYEIGLRLYDTGWIVGTMVVFIMNYLMGHDWPWELALVVVLFFLGICRWLVELNILPRRYDRKEENKKGEEKKEDEKKETKKPEEKKKEVRHDRRKDGRRWF